MGGTDLKESLHASLRREQHILVVAAAIAASISVEAVRTSTDVSNLVTWFVGCAVLAVIGRLWYRSRTRKCDELIATLASGAIADKVTVTRFTINYVIPFGYLVNFDAGALKSATFGFWTRTSAERFAAVLHDHARDSLPAARVVRSDRPPSAE